MSTSPEKEQLLSNMEEGKTAAAVAVATGNEKTFCSKLLDCGDIFKWLFIACLVYGVVTLIISLFTFLKGTLETDKILSVISSALLIGSGLLGCCRLSSLGNFHQKNKELRQQLDRFKLQIQDLEIINKDLQNNIQNLQQENNKAETNIEKLKASNREFSDVIQQLKNSKAALSEQLTQLHDDLDILREENERKATLNQELNREVGNLKVQVDRFKTAIETVGKYGDNFDDIVGNLTTLINRHQEILESDKQVMASIEMEHRNMLKDNLNYLYDQVCRDRTAGITEDEFRSILQECSGVIREKFEAYLIRDPDAFDKHKDPNTGRLRRGKGWGDIINGILAAQVSESFRNLRSTMRRQRSTDVAQFMAPGAVKLPPRK